MLGGFFVVEWEVFFIIGYSDFVLNNDFVFVFGVSVVDVVRLLRVYGVFSGGYFGFGDDDRSVEDEWFRG